MNILNSALQLPGYAISNVGLGVTFDTLLNEQKNVSAMCAFNSDVVVLVDNIAPEFEPKEGYQADGYSFFIKSNEGPRPHVHVRKDGKVSKFWVDTLELKSAGDMNRKELKEAQKHVAANQKEFLEQYKEHWEQIKPVSKKKQ